ncbi:MAG: MTH1187 family thiamine-binding protein [Gammaproteobacteria bacterium]
MHVMIDLCVVPIGVGVSVSNEIAECQRIIRDAGLKSQLHPYGTVIEGEWDDVMGCVKACHEKLHALGVPRVFTNMKVGTRIDRAQTMEDKVASVERKLEDRP